MKPLQPQGVQISFRKLPACGKTLVIGLACLVGSASARAQIPTPDAFSPFTQGNVNALAVQGDGKILVGGAIDNLPYHYDGVVRLFPDGNHDSAYYPHVNWTGGIFPAGVDSLILQPDGKVLLAGSFNQVGGQACNCIARLNPDGSLDTTFNASATGGYATCLALQADGKILVAGSFNTLNGQPVGCIGRLGPNGSVDSSFNSSVLGVAICSMALQPDSKIVIGGWFTNILGQTRTNIARLNPDGSLDAGFNAHQSWQGPVFSVALQPDGRILVGGRLQRLNADGTSDTNFYANVTGDANVEGFALQADGRIVVAGRFGWFNGQIMNGFGRLNPDGSQDIAFNPSPLAFIMRPIGLGATLQADGKILFCGTDLVVYTGGAQAGGVARFNSTDPATQNLNFDGSTITWQRGGTSPEVWRTTFESSADGTNWVMLGSGTRIAGGWELIGVSVPANSKVRARGYVLGGFANASGWIIESIWPKVQPSIFVDGTKVSGVTNGLNLKVVGTPGEIVVIDASENLSSWTPVVTNTLSSAPAYFCDWGITNFPSRFYRARLQ